jgi:glutamyl-tRNA reductase
MSVFALGLNHTTASIDLRERFVFNVDHLALTLQSFRAPLSHLHARPEVALLSTCNRTELYCCAHALSVEPALQQLANLGGVSAEKLKHHAYVLQGDAAVRHAFRVASGLDSMVLGEPQILGQMKKAVRQASQADTLGSTLHQLFQRSFAVAKEVRTSTAIGLHSISMAAATVGLAAQLFEDLSQTKVLLIGAGEMIELVATHFAARHPQHMAVANRTLERGAKLAEKFGAETLRLADLTQCLSQFDIIVSCTASSLPIIGLGMVERALKVRKHRPFFMVDLAVPRDIEPEVDRLSDVYLYTIDDLASAVQTAGEKRLAAVQQAQAIVDAGVQNFSHWLSGRNTVPLIQAITAQTNKWRATELARAQKLLAKGHPIEEVLQLLSRGLTQKMLHGIFAELRSADDTHRNDLAQTVSRIFLRE